MAIRHIPWLRHAPKGGVAPVYLALAQALETAIRTGELQPGDQLPPQRTVAALMGVDLTTVTRAYGVARSRGLVEGAVGRGTFVRRQAIDDDAGLVDLSMNLPPQPQGVSIAACLKATTAEVLQRTDAATLMAYHPGLGALAHRAAGAAWLSPVLGAVAPERVQVCPGAQAALSALVGSLVGRGGTLVVEPLTYPGMLAIAEQLGVRLIACPTDAEGLAPDALEAICRRERPAALYVIPTMQNPTGVTMPAARRLEIVRIARDHDLWIIEDDPYSRLMAEPLAGLASLAPERSFHIATLSKCLAPGLRLAFLVTPEGDRGAAAAEAVRSLAGMPAPLMSAVVASWIRDGTAEALVAGVRAEAAARRALAARRLPAAQGSPEAIHVWLPLPAGWSAARLRAAAKDRGLALVSAEAFAVGPVAGNGVRISLGAPGRREVLDEALLGVAALLDEGR
ncbi:PLP-dependent aminotransferase family protein [Phenylobacterium sp.]|uniref:aminotransferase-like domain-containing protein n=1 Tax=Phenylobacterium sp. TaxID=1871053 RepID=UPI0027307016|nr:PLP-dependent aminotransferase family protein [Phenylobacterium sp.]MDP1619291.1 PLP-dependent aminotransferase family protein [Phenylobacterium sp.]MDP1987754.1 PLP-dependent aminotransferase family protein [Phenylobacterium sp.]